MTDKDDLRYVMKKLFSIWNAIALACLAAICVLGVAGGLLYILDHMGR